MKMKWMEQKIVWRLRVDTIKAFSRKILHLAVRHWHIFNDYIVKASKHSNLKEH